MSINQFRQRKLGPSSWSLQALMSAIREDGDHIRTFQARVEYTRRTGLDWRALAPSEPRMLVSGIRWGDYANSD